MRPRAEPTQPKLTRRALGAGLAAGAAALGIGRGAEASVPVMDPDLRDAALRGLALADYHGDPVTAQAAHSAAARPNLLEGLVEKEGA